MIKSVKQTDIQTLSKIIQHHSLYRHSFSDDNQLYIFESLSLPFSVDLNGTSIHLSSSVRNLGVTLDQNLSFQQHVSRTCQICYFELRRINFIRHYLSQDALKTLVSAFVLSRIDYCNILLAGCPKQLIHKLQKVQNNAARLICRTPKSDHISPLPRLLH